MVREWRVKRKKSNENSEKNLFKAKLSVSHDGDDKDDDDDDNFLSEFKDVRSEHPNKIFFIHLMLIIYQKETWIG